MANMTPPPVGVPAALPPNPPPPAGVPDALPPNPFAPTFWLAPTLVLAPPNEKPPALVAEPKPPAPAEVEGAIAVEPGARPNPPPGAAAGVDGCVEGPAAPKTKGVAGPAVAGVPKLKTDWLPDWLPAPNAAKDGLGFGGAELAFIETSDAPFMVDGPPPKGPGFAG